MRKIKILQFPIAASNGGITHYAVDNWRWMNKELFQCDFATMSSRLPFAKELEDMGSHIYYISSYAEENLEGFIKEFEEILSHNYDVVHLHTKQWKSLTVEELCKKYKVPMVVVHSHSTRCDNNDAIVREQETETHFRIRNIMDKEIATDYWACSMEAAKWLYNDDILANVKLMKNAIDADKFSYDAAVRNRLRSQYNVEDKLVIGNVGRLVYPKNHEFLLRAFARSMEIRDDLILFIVGDGPLEKELKKVTMELCITDRVIFAGNQKNVNEYYQMFDLMALPSRFEGLPITLVEAQAAGLHCLAAEDITKEVQISELLTYLPLDIDKWSERFVNAKINNTRIDRQVVVKKAGYDIKQQITVVEDEYKKSITRRST